MDRAAAARAFMAMDAELRSRDEAVRDLCAYATQIDISNVPMDDADEEAPLPAARYRTLVAHHRLICRSIQDTIEGTRTVDDVPLNLMLLLPPGSAKRGGRSLA